MFNHSSQFDRLALVNLAALLLGTMLVPDASGWQQPATPCPCAADGVCQPNGPWGHTPTKWRPWPGDMVGPAPTPADEAETRERLQLDPFELPPIVKEGQRGPNKSKPPKAKRNVEDAAEDTKNNVLEPAVPLPEADPLEGIDPGASGIQDEFNLEPPAVEDPLKDTEPLPGLDLQDQAEPVDDFDPFSRLDPRRSTPAPANRLTSLAPPVLDDAPPQLPPSLRKLSRQSPPTLPATLRDSRFLRPAVATIQ
ncbi:MAG: hypothetical protein IH898_03975 [Planctomycetes bacterium]|nr:hypothetical protein [Planctomycetota bacterium]